MVERSSASDLAIAEWIQRNAIPIAHLEPGAGWADLASLRDLIGDARVVGLGEAAHGVHEFTALKHRLAEWLISELDFTAIALESSFAGCQPINDYILEGKGDPETVLTGQGYVPWDSEEFLALLRWLHAHNQTVAHDRRVAFYGVDTGFNEVGRRKVIEYLASHAPEQLDSAREGFAVLADLESRWPFLQEADQPTLAQAFAQLGALDEYLRQHEKRLAEQSSMAELVDVRQLLTVMLQWAEPGADHSRHKMGHNLLGIIDRERPDVKVIVWQANAHIGRAFRFDENHPTLGDVLAYRYGARYRPIGFEFGQGSYLSRTITTGMRPADLIPTVMPAPPGDSLPAHLAKCTFDVFALDLRHGDSTPAVESWLTHPQLAHGCLWVFTDPSTLYGDVIITDHYDAIIFIRNATPTMPTDNALESAAARILF